MTASDQPDSLNTSASSRAAENPNAESAAEKNPLPASETPAQEDVKNAASGDDQLETAKKEAKESHERYLRAIADLENFRRRTVREKDELRQFAAARVLEDLLPVLDNLVLAIAAAKAPGADIQKLVSGVAMVHEQLKTALGTHGLKEIAPTGEKFDPHQHESVAMQPSGDIPEGSVAQVVRTGYSLNGRLLRPATVILSSGPANTGETA